MGIEMPLHMMWEVPPPKLYHTIIHLFLWPATEQKTQPGLALSSNLKILSYLTYDVCQPIWHNAEDMIPFWHTWPCYGGKQPFEIWQHTHWKTIDDTAIGVPTSTISLLSLSYWVFFSHQIWMLIPSTTEPIQKSHEHNFLHLTWEEVEEQKAALLQNYRPTPSLHYIDNIYPTTNILITLKKLPNLYNTQNMFPLFCMDTFVDVSSTKYAPRSSSVIFFVK